MKFQSPPGMRDFYPADQRLQNWLFDHWRAASLAFGCEEYEGPIFEFLDLYTVKSGAEILTQLFHVRHGMSEDAKFAIRPEMTPTLARMIAARANALPRPIKWFTIPRMCRAERQQRGRLREFFQWNVDILGVDDPLADAEVIAVAAEFFRRVGVSAEDVVIRYSHRALAAAVMRSFGLSAEQVEPAFTLIDRLDKLSSADFAKAWSEKFGESSSPDALVEFLKNATLEQAIDRAEAAGGLDGAKAGEATAASAASSPAPKADAPAPLTMRESLMRFRQHLVDLGVADYCAFDFRVIRGLAYYTGTIFEAYPRKIASRALLGGGRYDNLTELVGGPRVPGVGFGSGDAPILDFLRDLGKLPETAASIDVFVIDADERFFTAAMRVASDLRRAGVNAEFSYKRQNLGKQLKQATSRNARKAIIVGEEFEKQGAVVVKNLADGSQSTTEWNQLRANANTLR